MRYQIQFPYSISTYLDFGPDQHPKCIFDWVRYLVLDYNGILKDFIDNNYDTTLIVKFGNSDDAQRFFQVFCEKLTPRMF